MTGNAIGYGRAMGRARTGTPAGRRAARRLFWRVGVALALANSAGACVVFTYLVFISPTSDTALQGTRATVVNALVFAGYMVFSIGSGTYWIARRGRSVSAWLIEGRPPTPKEIRTTLAQPFRLAGWTTFFWLLAAVVFGAVNAMLGARWIYVGRIFSTTLMAGLTVFVICYLLIDMLLRPTFAMVLQGSPPQRVASLGIMPKLLFSWMLGSAIPLVGVGLSHVGRDAEEKQNLTAPTWFLVGVGLVSGLLVTVIAARSFSRPLAQVRRGLRQVQAGDLDVTLVVDDGGEIGQLQAGVNSMAEGLRERRLLHDLFGRYVGEEVAREAVAHGVGLGGQRLAASALFVDVIGSTALARELTPEQVVEILNILFDTTVKTVTKHGGWVNKFDGDGALAVFGPPSGLTDHAAAALHAARDLRSDLRAMAKRYPMLDVGIGVSSGDVVAGNVGTEQRYEYTVIGDPVNEAARLTVLAKLRPSRVLASGAAVEASGDEAEHWSAVERVTLRGRDAETQTYEPVD